MEETFNTKAIVISRQPYREADSRVSVYTLEKGRLELIARGTQKLSSKLAAHIEPFNLADLMVIKGRKRNYVGSVITQDSFADIKNDLNKVNYAGRAFNIFNKLVRESEVDPKLFNLLLDFLTTMKKAAGREELLFSGFVLKLLAELGYKPELYKCLVCGREIKPNSHYFSLKKGGLVCGQETGGAGREVPAGTREDLKITPDCVKVMRLIIDNPVGLSLNLSISDDLYTEYSGLIEKYLRYNN